MWRPRLAILIGGDGGSDGARELRIVLVGDAARIEQHRAVLDARHDGRRLLPQARVEPIGIGRKETQRGARHLARRPPPAPPPPPPPAHLPPPPPVDRSH